MTANLLDRVTPPKNWAQPAIPRKHHPEGALERFEVSGSKVHWGVWGTLLALRVPKIVRQVPRAE